MILKLMNDAEPGMIAYETIVIPHYSPVTPSSMYFYNHLMDWCLE